MTVEKLIAILSKMPKRRRVVVSNGYEDGYEDVIGCKPINLLRDANKKPYDGPHQKVDKDKAGEIHVLIDDGIYRGEY